MARTPYNPTYSGTHYLRVYSYSSGPAGAYLISVNNRLKTLERAERAGPPRNL